MRLSAHLTTIPYGTAAGAPCVELDMDVPTSHEDAQHRRGLILQSLASLRGTACFWFPRPPWAEPGAEAGLLPIIEQVGSVIVSMDVFSEAQTSLNVTQIIDATRLLVQPVEPSQLRAALAQRLRVPRAEEVVIAPHVDNLTGAHLDVVSEFLATAGVEPLGFVYVDEHHLQAAMLACAKAGTLWRALVTQPQRARIPLIDINGAEP